MLATSIKELHSSLVNKKISATELTSFYLERIKKYANLNAFISIDEEGAMASAAIADKNLASGNANLLTGIPMAHKDIFCTQNTPTTCGSKMLENFVSPFNATIVNKLQDKHVVMLGKANMDEFAMGSTNENSYFKPVKNPWNDNYVPGGSSGGSAAAVAANLAIFTTGSDTGGSIRQPAAFCGISGIKPTYGRVSRFGMIAFASSLDQAGPMAKSAEDLAIILSSIAGFDELDSTSVNEKVPNYYQELNAPINKLKIGIPGYFFNDDIDPDVKCAIDEAVKIYNKAGCEIIPIDFSLHDMWIACYYVVACAEASANLERFDGVRFGYRSAKCQTIDELIINSRTEGFGDEVKRRILTGTFVLSSGYYDAYYVQAQKVRHMIQEEIKAAFKDVDIILGPTTPTCAFKLGVKSQKPTDAYLADKFTVVANLAGLPAMSIPAGFKNGMPIGMQLIGNHFQETHLLQCAHYFQQQTDWHLKNAINGDKSL